MSDHDQVVPVTRAIDPIVCVVAKTPRIVVEFGWLVAG